MRVLIIDEWVPLPLHSGKKIRTFNLVKRLAIKHEILYLAYVNLPTDKEKVLDMGRAGIRVVPVQDTRTPKWTLPFYLELILNVFSSKPFSTIYHIKDAFRKRFLEVLCSEKPDLVVCEWTNLAPFLEQVKDIPTLIVAHNVESNIWKRLAENASNPFMKLLGWQQAKRIELLEKEWYPKVNHCIAVSEEDARVIRSYGANVSVVENGVDTEYYEGEFSGPSKGDIMFVASFDVFTNQDAVDFFVQKVFPLIVTVRPDASFWIVGKDPPDKIREYAKTDARIHVTGTVTDTRDYLSRSAICVVPIRIGGGSRLKILEAMAMKRPVISTSVGAEGLKISPGEDILIADTPQDLADKVLWLLSHEKDQAYLAEAGRQLAVREYDWKSLAAKQDNVWQSLK